MRLPLIVALFVGAAGCAQDDPYQKVEPSPESDRAPAPESNVPTPASRTAPNAADYVTPKAVTPEAVTPKAVTPKATRPPTPVKPLTVTAIKTSIVSGVVAEDGVGQRRATSTGAVAIDIQFDVLPGRALDPVLEIGANTFRHYEVRPDGVLRYVVLGRDLAEAGEVVLRWGPDVLVLADRLDVK